jgi:hypothetical protein
MGWKCGSYEGNKSFTQNLGRDHLAGDYLKTRKEMEE